MIDLGRPDEGRQVLDNLVQEQPSYSPAFNHLGYAYLRMEENEKAIGAFHTFLTANSTNPSAYDSAAEGFQAIGEYDKAIASLAKAVLLDPKFAYGWMHMGDILTQSGDREIAWQAYQKAISAAELYGTDFTSSVRKKMKELEK